MDNLKYINNNRFRNSKFSKDNKLMHKDHIHIKIYKGRLIECSNNNITKDLLLKLIRREDNKIQTVILFKYKHILCFNHYHKCFQKFIKNKIQCQICKIKIKISQYYHNKFKFILMKKLKKIFK